MIKGLRELKVDEIYKVYETTPKDGVQHEGIIA